MPRPAFICALAASVPFRTLRSNLATMSLTPLTSPPTTPSATRFIAASKAAAIDDALMSAPYSHTLPQLMELAGLAVAHAVADLLPPANVALVCGPGNNGGDGLVAARHLSHFGYSPCVIYPRVPERHLFQHLLQQLRALQVPVVDRIPAHVLLVVDAVFGFSFRGDRGVRPPFDAVFRDINQSAKPVLSVDVPSGWHVDRGPVWDNCVRSPDAVISLTAPKMCLREYAGIHYVGGRFVPPRLLKELDFQIPHYPGTNDIVRIS